MTRIGRSKRQRFDDKPGLFSTGWPRKWHRMPSIEVDTLHHRVVVGIVGRGRRGTGPGEFHYPSSAVVVNDRAYVADSWNHRIRCSTSPIGNSHSNLETSFVRNGSEVVNDRGNPLLAVVDTNNRRLCFHKPDGSRVTTAQFALRSFPIMMRLRIRQRFRSILKMARSGRSISSIVHPAWWTTKLKIPVSIARDAARVSSTFQTLHATRLKSSMWTELCAEFWAPAL